MNWDEVRRAITPRTRAILVNTPHNPTGTTWTADDMRQLASIVDGTDIILIGDEVYEHIIFDGRRHESLLRYPELRSRSVVISSFGKTFHTTGWKVGYCVGAAAADRRSDARAPVHHVHRAHAVADRLRGVRDARSVGERRCRRSTSRSAICSCSSPRARASAPLPCDGTYFQLFDYSAISQTETDKEIAHRLIVEHGVASIPVSAFLYKDTGGPVLRFCFAKKDETLRAAAERLIKI